MPDQTNQKNTITALAVMGERRAVARREVARSADMETILKRRDFLAAAKRGEKRVAKSLIMQVRDRGDDGAPRVGITATRKIGNAVARNRAKRRLRALARETLAPLARDGHDYVLIARYSTAALSWRKMRDDCAGLLRT